MAFAWTVFIWSALAVMLIRTQRNLNRIRVVRAEQTPVHAGETAQLILTLQCSRGERRGLVLDFGTPENASPVFNLVAGQPVSVVLPRPLVRRGEWPFGCIRVNSHQPVGVALAFAWVWPEASFLVYPSPEEEGPPPQPIAAASLVTPAASAPHVPTAEPDSSSLRLHRPGDGMRRISWKASARHQRLLTRDDAREPQSQVVLHWQNVTDLPRESGISRLARWVVESDRNGRTYTLVLPEKTVGPHQGPAHFHACMAALARLPA